MQFCLGPLEYRHAPPAKSIRVFMDHVNGYNFQVVTNINGKEASRYSGMGRRIFDNGETLCLLFDGGILIIDKKNSEIKGKLPWFTAFDPRVILAKDHILLTETGVFPLTNAHDVVEHPKAMTEWLTETRSISAYDTNPLGVLWTAPETEIGIPLGWDHGRLCTLALTNTVQVLRHILDQSIVPQFVIFAIDPRSGAVRRRTPFHLNKNQSWFLAKNTLGSQGPGKPMLSISDHDIKITRLFGRTFTAKRSDHG